MHDMIADLYMGIFPDVWKIFSVTPIHKSGDLLTFLTTDQFRSYPIYQKY